MKKSLFFKWLVLGTLFILSTACSLTTTQILGSISIIMEANSMCDPARRLASMDVLDPDATKN